MAILVMIVLLTLIPTWRYQLSLKDQDNFCQTKQASSRKSMPKQQKMHSRGRAPPAALHKPDGADEEKASEENARNFQLELCWCIQQLERVLSEKKLGETKLQESWKVLTVLKNNNQPLVRKRQLMRTHLGDYRAKMAQEEKKLIKMANSLKITDAPAKPKATFIRRSAFLTTGDSSFRFNFELTPEQIQNAPPAPSEPSEVGTSETDETSDSALKSDTSVTNNKAFKFSFTNSPFMFNFKENEE